MSKKLRSRKTKIFRAILIILVVLFLLLIAFSCFIGMQVVAGSTQLVTNESTSGVTDEFWDQFDINYDEFCKEYHVDEERIISSFDGHEIPADYIYKNGKNNDTVIMVHGLGGNRYDCYPVAKLFLENGYNVITYDQRSSNENTAENTTFGYWEKYDLIDYLKYARQNAPEKKIGVWGTSFGGATAVQGVAYENTQTDISFLILDCPVSSMEWMVQHEMENMNTGLPVEYMTFCGNIANRLKFKFSYKDADSAEAAKKIKIPTLVINSEADEITPYFMGKNIYDNLNSKNKNIWTVTDSKHTCMWVDYNDEYCRKVEEIINK